jgi:menaquinone-dependent protoporphyrinogen oxidase
MCVIWPRQLKRERARFSTLLTPKTIYATDLLRLYWQEETMRILVTWSSKRGATEGIGQTIGEELKARGFEVTAASVDHIGALDSFDTVIVGGALYANRWPRKARRFVNHHVRELRKIPVWLFSSGPLDDSADGGAIPPTAQVAVLAEKVGAKGHVTFGGRLVPDTKGFPASAMAKNHSGDWRNPIRIRQWAAELATEIPNAKPSQAIDHPARSIRRLLLHGLLGWALCAAIMAGLLTVVGLTPALLIHAIAAALLFALIAWHYFRARGARGPISTAIIWTANVALLDLIIVAGGAQHSLEMFKSFAGSWLPFGLIFLVTWTTGEVISMLPEAKTFERWRIKDRKWSPVQR